MKTKAFLFSCLLITFFGCKKEKVTMPTLQINPYDIVLNYKMGEVVTFRIKANSPAGLSNVKISAKEASSFTENIIDSTLSGSQTFSWNYEYKIPLKSSAYEMDIYFVFTDKNNVEISSARRINVSLNSSTIVLTEYNGNVFYAKASGKEDAFNLINRTPHFSTSTLPEIVDLKNDGTYDAADSLARSWVSLSGATFVRFNGFDYDNATPASILTTYDSGIKLDTLRNIQVGDIIFTKVSRSSVETYCVMKLTSIFDLPGSTDDTYIFSLKK